MIFCMTFYIHSLMENVTVFNREPPSGSGGSEASSCETYFETASGLGTTWGFLGTTGTTSGRFQLHSGLGTVGTVGSTLAVSPFHTFS